MSISTATAQWAGRLANLAGLPSIVRECRYTSKATSTHVTVRCTSLYTVITVNGVDVYFHRLTGSIDGVGVSQAADAAKTDVKP